MILVLVGKSSSGKDTALKELNLEKCTSTTSRPMRSNEKEGIDYFFISKEEFIRRIEAGELIEYRTYCTLVDNKADIWYYGTEAKNIDFSKDTVLVLDLQGLKDLKDYMLNNNINEKILGLYLHCPTALRTERAKNRGSFCEIEWKRRLKADALDFENVYTEVDYILNSSVSTELLVKEIEQIIKDNK